MLTTGSSLMDSTSADARSSLSSASSTSTNPIKHASVNQASKVAVWDQSGHTGDTVNDVPARSLAALAELGEPVLADDALLELDDVLPGGLYALESLDGLEGRRASENDAGERQGQESSEGGEESHLGSVAGR